MERHLEIRRHADGSIDFDFYRRNAREQRQRTHRVLARRGLVRLIRRARALAALLARGREVSGQACPEPRPAR